MSEATAPADPRPVMPREPEDGACCQSGCDPCVYDHYWEALSRYEQALRDWTTRHAERAPITQCGLEDLM